MSVIRASQDACCASQQIFEAKVAVGSDFAQVWLAPMDPTRFQGTLVGKGKDVPKAEVAGEAYAAAATDQFAETPMASKAASIVA
jgi:hypothetical protein